MCPFFYAFSLLSGYYEVWVKIVTFCFMKINDKSENSMN